MSRSKHRCARMLSASLLVCALAACGGSPGGSSGGVPPADNPNGDGTAPQATLDVTGGALGKSQAIVVRFSESMDVASLRLGGDLGAEAAFAWSTGSAENDTLTVTPRSGTWSTGGGRQLVIDASDKSGTPMTPLQASYVVVLQFANFQPAIAAIGQADFTGDQINQGAMDPSATSLNAPAASVVSPDGALFVADFGNNRVLRFSTIPSSSGTAAAVVLGQPDFGSQTGGVGRGKLYGPMNPGIGNGKMVVADSFSNRVVIYNSIPDQGSLPDIVLGQPDFDTAAANCTASGMEVPESATITDDGKVIVTDTANNRVLIWNEAPTRNGQPPDLVLGQLDAVHCSPNDNDGDGASEQDPTARTLNRPAGVWSDGKRLVVVDRANSRVLIWSTFPTSSFAPADLVLGQGSFTIGAYNDDDQDGNTDFVPTARTMNMPSRGVASNGVQLAIADTDNNRVLVWNSFPTSSFQPADVVLGQDAFNRATLDDDNQDGNPDGTPSARGMDGPAGVTFHRDSLIVTDLNNNRLLVFKAP